MDEKIEVCTDRIKNCIKQLNKNEFLTSDVLKFYSGNFCANIDTPAHYSFNAQFGKILQRNSEKLGIKEIDNNVSITDDFEHPTSCSKWKKLYNK